MKTYQLPGGHTMRGVCTCGRCRPQLRDERGNVDYGMVWSEARGTYVARRCEIAAARREARS